MLKTKDSGQAGTRILLDAMSKDKIHLAKFVLDALDGEIVDSKTDGAHTPLISSVLLPDGRMRCKFIELLLQKGASVNCQDGDGRTALSHACETGHLDAVKILVRNNADPDIVDAWGNTALMYAAAAAQTQVVEFLVRAFRRLGLQIDKQNKAGNSAIQVAKFLGHTDCVFALTNFSKRNREEGKSVEKVEFLQTCDQTHVAQQKLWMKQNSDYFQMDEKLSSDHYLPPLKYTPKIKNPSALGILLTPLTSRPPADMKTDKIKGFDLCRFNDSYYKKRCSLPAVMLNQAPAESTVQQSKLLPWQEENPTEFISTPTTFSVISNKLLRRFTSPEFKKDAKDLELDPVTMTERIPRSETFPQVHPPVDSTLSIHSITSVQCEFDFQLRKTKTSS